MLFLGRWKPAFSENNSIKVPAIYLDTKVSEAGYQENVFSLKVLTFD